MCFSFWAVVELAHSEVAAGMYIIESVNIQFDSCNDVSIYIVFYRYTL